MKKATTAIFIDTYHQQKDGKCAVKIKVTHNRERKYYPTGISLTEKEFLKTLNPGEKWNEKKKANVPIPRTEEQKKIYSKLQAFEAKANDIIEKLELFTFPLFEKLYLRNREAINTISYAFDEYITQLKLEDRIGTAMSYDAAKSSLESFRKGMRFADITPTLLKSYEAWMYEQGKSPTTVGIYLRSLRTIFNQAEIDKALYPFAGKNKYKIPAGRNIKKALTLEEISKIFNAKLEPGSTAEMARDYWVFIYLSNGINMKDFCLLKYKNIDGDFISFQRAKSIRTKKVIEQIRISLKDDARAVIKKWGQKSLSPETYIFPHLRKGLTAARQRQLTQQLTQLVNNHMDVIVKDLEIHKNVTTYTARHSFATVLKRSGASIEFISDALGHGDIKTTQSYLAGFEDETLEKVTEALTAFKK